MTQSVKQYLCLSRIPKNAVKREIDGNLYALIPHKFDGHSIVENYQKPRLVRAAEYPSFQKGGEAYVWFATVGEQIRKNVAIPFGVTILEKNE